MAVSLTPFEVSLSGALPKGEVADGFAASGFPSRRAEAWKWSDLRGALKGDRAPSSAYDHDKADSSPLLAGISGPELVIENGSLRAPAELPVSIRVRQSDAAPVLWPNWPVASLATAAPLIDIEITETLGAPLFIRRLSQGDGWHADRIRVGLAEGATATVIETHKATGAPFSNSLTHFLLAEGSQLTRILVQQGADDAVLVHNADMHVSEGARVTQMTLAGGAALCRLETSVALTGKASVRLDGAYRLSGQRHCDITSLVDHTVPGCMTRQLVKGVVEDRARAVFQGKFHVDQRAQRTDARMGHHAILLNDGASVNAKPELEIYADDVECAHGNTVGALDPNALFYMRQRGLSDDAARRLLIEAFYAEVFDSISDEALRHALIEVMKEVANAH